jgi:hypothetical protein
MDTNVILAIDLGRYNVSAHHRHRYRGADCGEQGLISPCSRCVAGLA